LKLTPAGEALLQEGEHLLAAAERAVRWTLEMADAKDGEIVRLAFVPGTPTDLVTMALRTADRLGDGSQVQLHRIEWDAQAGCVPSGVADIAFVQLPLDAKGTDVVALITVPRVAVFAANHRLAQRDHVCMEDLASEPIVDAIYNRSYWLVDPRPDGSSPVVVGPAAATAEAMLAFVGAGRGMAITSLSLSESYPRADLAFVVIADLAPVTYALAWRNDERRPAVRRLIDAIQRESVTAGARR
jgi:DNA-binding transcriptional LysR family regulator